VLSVCLPQCGAVWHYKTGAFALLTSNLVARHQFTRSSLQTFDSDMGFIKIGGVVNWMAARGIGQVSSFHVTSIECHEKQIIMQS